MNNGVNVAYPKIYFNLRSGDFKPLISSLAIAASTKSGDCPQLTLSCQVTEKLKRARTLDFSTLPAITYTKWCSSLILEGSFIRNVESYFTNLV